MRFYLQLASFLLVPTCLAADYHFDGSASNDGDGNSTSPFSTLKAIANLELKAGDNVLLKRGSAFSEPLVLDKSGAANAPITIQAYGEPKLAKPEVTAGKNDLNAVLLQAASHVVVQDLGLSNPGDNSTTRRGVYVYASDAGQVQDVTLQRLHIHNVTGYMPSTTGDWDDGTGKFSNASGGIVFEAAGNKTATYFTDITVQENELRTVDREGIYFWTNWCRRKSLVQFWYPLCFQPWQATTGLVVQRNRLYDIGGDGIAVHGTEDAVVHNNTVTGYNRRSESPNAGIWTANTDGTVFRYNVVSQGKTIMDGMSFDVDHSTSGTVYEYNVSHDNEGGFFLLCPYDTPIKNFTIRYNLSVNDKARIFQVCDGAMTGGKIYKNTIYIGEGISPVIVTEDTKEKLDVVFADNIIRKEGSGNATWHLNDDAFKVTHNAFSGAIGKYPSAENSITDPPGLTAPGLRDPKAYILFGDSPALDSAQDIDGDAAQDFFTNPITHENMGFYSGAGRKEAVWISHFDDSKTCGWTAKGNVTVVQDPGFDLGKSAKISQGATYAHQLDVSQPPYRFNARVWVESDTSLAEDFPSVRIGDVSEAVLSSASAENLRRGEWQILEVTVSSACNAKATLDGESMELSKSSCDAGKVTFKAGGASLYIDDVFVTPL